MQKQIATDWQKCAEALNLKLNLIVARLKELNRETISADVAYITAQLVEEFQLETNQMFIRPDIAALQKKLDFIISKVSSIPYTPFLKQSDLVSQCNLLLSKFAFDLAILAAFSLETKNV